MSLVLLQGILWHSFGTVGNSLPEITKPQRVLNRCGSTDRVGFEPTVRYKRTQAFQACALNHSATCPNSEKKSKT